MNPRSDLINAQKDLAYLRRFIDQKDPKQM